MIVTEENLATTQQQQQESGKSISMHVNEALVRYFTNLGTEEPVDLYKIVLEEVEVPLFEAIMRYTRGNQSKAARLLGISRGTLRKKLAEYFETTHVGKQREQ